MHCGRTWFRPGRNSPPSAGRPRPRRRSIQADNLLARSSSTESARYRVRGAAGRSARPAPGARRPWGLRHVASARRAAAAACCPSWWGWWWSGRCPAVVACSRREPRTCAVALTRCDMHCGIPEPSFRPSLRPSSRPCAVRRKVTLSTNLLLRFVPAPGSSAPASESVMRVWGPESGAGEPLARPARGMSCGTHPGHPFGHAWDTGSGRHRRGQKPEAS